MVATWHDDGVELFIKMVAGLETISNFAINMSLYYTDADFSWPDYLDDWSSRSGAKTTVSRVPVCATGGTITSMRGVFGNSSGGYSVTEYIMEYLGIDVAITLGQVANPKMSIEFKR